MNKKVVVIIAVIALVAILAVCLTACNADSISKKLDKAGYVVTSVDQDDIGDDVAIEWGVAGVKGEFSLSGEISGDMVTVIKFAELDDAKKYAEEAEKSKMTVKRISKIVYVGTEQGVKDAM